MTFESKFEVCSQLTQNCEDNDGCQEEGRGGRCHWLSGKYSHMV